jgi:hypothetical protein
MKTSEDCMRGAFAAILRGDYAERDRLADRASQLMAAEMKAQKIQEVMVTDFFVTAHGIAIPTTVMLKQVGVLN